MGSIIRPSFLLLFIFLWCDQMPVLLAKLHNLSLISNTMIFSLSFISNTMIFLQIYTQGSLILMLYLLASTGKSATLWLWLLCLCSVGVRFCGPRGWVRPQGASILMHYNLQSCSIWFGILAVVFDQFAIWYLEVVLLFIILFASVLHLISWMLVSLDRQ